MAAISKKRKFLKQLFLKIEPAHILIIGALLEAV
jgi:hypothetical protein